MKRAKLDALNVEDDVIRKEVDVKTGVTMKMIRKKIAAVRKCLAELPASLCDVEEALSDLGYEEEICAREVGLNEINCDVERTQLPRSWKCGDPVILNLKWDGVRFIIVANWMPEGIVDTYYVSYLEQCNDAALKEAALKHVPEFVDFMLSERPTVARNIKNGKIERWGR